MHVSENGDITVITIWSKSQTNLLCAGHIEYALGLQLHCRRATEHKVYRGNENILVLVRAEIVTRVEYGELRRGGVLGHALAEGGAESGVGSGGEARDDGAGVDDGTAARKEGGTEREFYTIDSDGNDVETVEGGAARKGGEGGVDEIAVGAAAAAKGEVAGGASGGREAVGEDFVVL